MEKLVLVVLFLLSFSAFSQGGEGGTDGGGPGMVLKYVDDNGQLQQFVVDDPLDIPNHLLEQYMKQVGNINLDRTPLPRRDFRALEKEFVNLGNAYDVTTNDGYNLDREMLRDIKPSWMKEEDGDIWVRPSAPIRDYQRSDGAVVDFDLSYTLDDDE
jgi:hypothetical protein